MTQNARMEWPKLKRTYPGLKVKTTRLMSNMIYDVPEGTVCDVEGYYRVLTLIGSPCPSCCVRVRLRQVPQEAVELIGR